MKRAAVTLRRPALALAAILAVLGMGVIALWVSTPSADDVQQRVRERIDRLGVVLLQEDEVPSLLAKAVVATEDEARWAGFQVSDERSDPNGGGCAARPQMETATS